jgi:hypothetical protein
MRGGSGARWFIDVLSLDLTASRIDDQTWKTRGALSARMRQRERARRWENRRAR